MPPPAANGFRLIFADPYVGQVVKTFSSQVKGVRELVKLLMSCEDYRFQEVCGKRKLDPSELGTASGLVVRGFDNARRVLIRGDEELQHFFLSLTSAMASIEISLAVARQQFTPPVEMPKARSSPPSLSVQSLHSIGSSGNRPRDRTEELENQSSTMFTVMHRVERALHELTQKVQTSEDQVDAMVQELKSELKADMAKAASEVSVKVIDLKYETKTLNEKLQDTKIYLLDVEKRSKDSFAHLTAELQALSYRSDESFKDVNSDILSLKDKDAALDDEDARQNKLLLEHKVELERLEEVKLDIATWDEREAENAASISKRFDDSAKALMATRDELEEARMKLKEDLEEADAKMLQKHVETVERIDADIAALNQDLQESIKKGGNSLQAVREDLERQISQNVTELDNKINHGFKVTRADIQQRDAAINRRTDELKAGTEETIRLLDERIAEAARIERARMNTMERDTMEGFAKIRSDFRSELERVRGDYEQDNNRIHEDLGELHMKIDVTKQEINFFQSRLADQKEWTQRALVETATATKAFSVDAQEGLSAANKMLIALRDDAVGFREKMAKYISVLQSASDQYADSIATLEAHRDTTRMDLDAIIDDHGNYTSDMDDWAKDVTVKVERLFRALEPSRAQWVIHGAREKLKKLNKPLAVKTKTFSLKGLAQMQFEFYPQGSNHQPAGASVLRLLMPPTANVRYECFLGRQSSGPLSYDGLETTNYAVDINFENYKDYLREDDSLIISIEVIQDMMNKDESLCPQVEIKSAF